MKNKRKYKFTTGIQQITPDTPDYSKAYELKAEQNAKNKGISQAAGMFSGAYAPIGQVGGMAADVIRSNNKSKGGAVAGGALEMGASGAALGASIGGPWGAAIGGVGGAIYGGIAGSKEYTKGKRLQEEAERKAMLADNAKGYSIGSSTDAQSFLAKKGKYKVKTKEPRLIETEGREPIFSPKKADGSRDLLYYNPNDPTHEEGGVKAMVIPKASDGKKKTKVEKKPEPLIDTDSWTENIAEIFDPTGITSWDDAYRSIKNLKNDPKKIGNYTTAGADILGAVPVLGKLKYLIKAGKAARKATSYSDFVGDFTSITSSLLGDQLDESGFDYKRGTYKGRNIFPAFTETYKNAFKNQIKRSKKADGVNSLMPKRSKVSLLGSGNMAVGAKQLKVNTLNDAALSSNLTGMPAVNAANKFIQPTAGIQQVARNIPEVRRKEKINTPRSHKKVNPDTNRIIDPPMLYEMKPPPPRSTFNTKNDFNKGSKKVKVYR